MRKYLVCVFLLVATMAYTTEAGPLEPLERSLCFFHDLCGRSNSVTAFCRLMGHWNGLDGSRMKAVCEDADDDHEDDDEDEEEDEEEDHEDDDDE